MTDAVNITKQDSPQGGSYIATLDGERAEMTYTRVNDDLVSIDHTFVPEALRGRGIAQALAAYAVQDIRQLNGKLVAKCSFMQAQLKRHPEWSDVEKSQQL